jgi:hypothetical protein
VVFTFIRLLLALFKIRFLMEMCKLSSTTNNAFSYSKVLLCRDEMQ